LISRYVLREALGAWLVVVAILFLILMTNQFAEILGEAASDRLPRDAVFAIFALTSLSYLTALTPIALFLGVMLALARLSRDSEMAALSACGVGPSRLLVPIMTLTLVLAAALAWLALYETPAASRQIDAIRFQAKQEMQLGALQAGQFTSPDSGATVLYPQEVVDGEARGVFVQREEGDRVVAIVAARAERTVDPATGELWFVLHDGRRYEGVPGSNEFLVLGFDEHGIPVRPSDKPLVEAPAAKSTLDLWRSNRLVDRAELEYRLSVPISLFVLALLAVPLSRSSPREGRYARLGIGLLIYVIYANSLAIAQVWLQRGVTPLWAGIWWVHVLGFACALWLLERQSGLFVRMPIGRPATA
jgi:lipopolysaccharide export system permease protein